MPSRLPNIFSSRARSPRRPTQAARSRRDGRDRECAACGRALVAHDHAIQLPAGTFHAGCVLYRPRVAPTPPTAVEQRLQATR